MKFSPEGRRTSPRIEIAPFVDVVFLLLIFFMLTSTFIVAPGLKIKLPKAKTKEIQREKREISIAITRDGTIYYEGRKVDLKELEKELRKFSKRGLNPLIVIKADERTYHGRVVEVMDTAKQAGLSRFAIATTPKEVEK